jgi:hypothetical protein
MTAPNDQDGVARAIEVILRGVAPTLIAPEGRG